MKVIDSHCELRFSDIPCSFFREVSNDISRHSLSIRKRRIFNLERDCILDSASHFLFLFLLYFCIILIVVCTPRTPRYIIVTLFVTSEGCAFLFRILIQRTAAIIVANFCILYDSRYI